MKGNSRIKAPILCLLIVTLSVILIVAYPDAMGGLGGVILFTILVAGLLELLLSISAIFKKNHEISEHIIISMLLLFLFIGFINFIAFLEANTEPENYDKYHGLFIAMNVASFIFLYIYMVRLSHYFKTKKEIKSEIISDHFKVLLSICYSIFLIAESFIVLGTSLYLVMIEVMPYDSLLRIKSFTMTNIVLSVLITSFLISLIYTAKLNAQSVSRFITNRETGITKEQLLVAKKYFLPFILVITILGTGLEISRGLMYTWFLTLLFIIIAVIHLWKVLMLVIEAKEITEINHDTG